MKDKKAFLLGEYTLKIIIAVVCLLLLAYVLFNLYSNSEEEKDLRMAQATLDELGEKMEEARTTSQEQTITLLEPSDWYVYTFRQDFINKPVGCESNCLCVCDSSSSWGGNAGACDNKGVCKNFVGATNFKNLRENHMEVFGDFSINYEEGKFTILKK